MKLYADISKTEPQDDGTLKVWGFASSDAKDSDGETITPDAMKAAIPDYMKFGAVREMHGSSAAGTAIEIAVDEVGKTTFGAHIIDPIAVKKISHGVYKGFSIGGKATSRDPVNKTIITGLKLVEVSLVDRPANPDAVFTMFKAEKSTDEVADLEKSAIADIAEMLNSKTITPSQILKAAKDSLVKVEPKVEPAAEVVPAVEAVAKAGKQFSAKTQAALADVHATAQSVCDKMSALNYQDADEPADAPADDAAKAAAVELAKVEATKVGPAGIAGVQGPGPCPMGPSAAEALDKAELAKTELAKVAAADLVKAELAKRDDLITKLSARLEILEAQPMPGKALLKAIAKGDDVETPIQDSELPKDATPEMRALDGIKKAFRTGGRIVG
jgi:hypothetical protein